MPAPHHTRGGAEHHTRTRDQTSFVTAMTIPATTNSTIRI
jgi:hypothetical protein